MDNQTQETKETQEVNIQKETQETPTQEQTPNPDVEKTKEYEDRHKLISIFLSNKEDVDINKLSAEFDKLTPKEQKFLRELAVLPVCDYKRIVEFLDKITKLDDDVIQKEYTQEQRTAVALNTHGSKYALENNLHTEEFNHDKSAVVNDLSYSDKSLNMRKLDIKKTQGLSSNDLLAIFRSFISVGQVVHVPLWHSGFWVVIKPPTQTEIVNLRAALTKEEITLGRNTSTLVYSNYGVVFKRLVTEFIVKHINSTSLILPEDADITEYISVLDYYPLVLGLISTFYPEGIQVSRSCVNSHVLENNTPKCTFNISATVDPNKLLHVNRNALSRKMLEHMAQKQNGVHTLDSVKEYQLGIASTSDKIYDITLDNGQTFKVQLGIPNLKKHISDGEIWVDRIIEQAEGLVAENASKEDKENKVDEIAISCILGTYNTYIKAFTYPNPEGKDITNTDTSTFTEMLATMTIDDKGFESFRNAIRDYLSRAAIAIVAVTNYTCPVCKTHQADNKGPFEEFIPINTDEYFLVLSGLRATKTYRALT